VADSTGVISETNEGENEYTRTINVESIDPPGYSTAWVYQSEEAVNSVAVSSQGRYVAIGTSANLETSSKIHFVDINKNLLWEYQTSYGDSPLVGISMTADASQIVAATSRIGGGTAYFLNLAGQLQSSFGATALSSISLSPEGNYYAFTYLYIGFDDQVMLREYRGNNDLWNKSIGHMGTGAVSVSANGEYIAIGAEVSIPGYHYPPIGGGVKVYNKAGNLLWEYLIDSKNHYGEDEYSVAISSDGQYVVAGSAENNGLRLFNHNGQLLWTYNTNPIQRVSISSGGNHILAATSNQLYLFDRNKNLLWTLKINDIQDIAMSSDTNTIILATNPFYTSSMVYFWKKVK
jgi:WD40 repeat protein